MSVQVEKLEKNILEIVIVFIGNVDEHDGYCLW